MESRKYCAITYDGKKLDEIVPGYLTINVEGRGLLAPDLNTITIEGRDGDYVLNQDYKARDIKVYFLVKVKNNSERLEIIEKLDVYLKTDKDVEFSFEDQDGFWIGRYSDAQDINFDYFTGVGYFVLHCQNPYRHMPLIKYSSLTFTVESDLYKKLELYELKASVSDTKEVRLTNKTKGEVISLKNLPSLGDLVISKKEITLNGKNIINKLDPSVSTWKNFRISSEDILTISGASEATCSIRRYL